MLSPNYSFTGPTAETIVKISQAIKEVDTSAPSSLHNHRRYLYLVRRLAREMEIQIHSWEVLDARAQFARSLIAVVDRELDLPPEYHEGQSEDEGRETPQQLGVTHDESAVRPARSRRCQGGTTAQQIGARFADFPDMLPAPPFMQTARTLGFATPPQYTAMSSSPPMSAARLDYRATTEDEDRRADAFRTHDTQTLPMEARVTGRRAYLRRSQNTAVDYSSSQPKEDDE
jgi:hypothetical protein